MQAGKTLTRGDWMKLILALALFLGLLIRIFPAMLVGFPLNDGGMFYVMSLDLRANGFLLPAFTTYNAAHIPFAYPPLGFYMAGLLGALGLPELQVFLWLPILVSVLTIPAFYFLARALLEDAPRAALATLVFALIPKSYGNEIMGGGVTRAFGVLFFVLAIYAVYQMLHSQDRKFLFLSILFCSLAVLSHPEIILATASGCALLCVFYVRSWRKGLSALLTGLGVLALTSPWWGSVLAMHGLSAFLSAGGTGAYGDSPFKMLYLDFLTPASLLTFFGLLRIIGILWSLIRRQHFFLLAWMMLPYFVEPRSESGVAFLPSCVFVALALSDAIPEALGWLGRKWGRDLSVRNFMQNRVWNLGVLALTLIWFVGGTFYDFSLANTSLKPSLPQQTFAWVREHTPADSQFLIITGNDTGLMSDPVHEWFPALAGRRSPSTLQGLEWTLHDQFFPRLDAARLLQRCQTAACVQGWAADMGLSYTHLLIEKNDLTAVLVDSLHADKDYAVIYENSKYVVFKRIAGD